jgi:surface antigen
MRRTIDLDQVRVVQATTPDGQELAWEQAAEIERHGALIAEAQHHASNIASEMRRYASAGQHIESVYRLRLGLPEPEEKP